ncbi:MAG: hypothetical protein ACRERE_16125 [Candidatus Entotheonellia bacterium]
MHRLNADAVPAVTRWRTLPLERKLHWILRIGVVGCFIGHGAYGLMTKEVWVPYFGVVGFDRAWAYQLMPWIGVMDISLGLTMALVPLPIVLLHLTVWGVWTAVLRPLSGDSVWESVERAGNYGTPLAFLALVGVPRSLRGWFASVWPSDISPLTVDRAWAMHWILRVTTCLLLLGHGALGALNSKPALTAHYASIGLHNVAVGGLALTWVVGCLEIVFAVAVLVAPLPSLLLGICLWKMGTETLFMTSGSLPFEWIERAGSYMAPLALYYLVVTNTCRHGTWLFLRQSLTSSPPGAGGKARRCWKGSWMVLSGPTGCAIKGSPANAVTASGAMARDEEGGSA